MALPLHYKAIAWLYKRFLLKAKHERFNKFMLGLAYNGLGINNFQNSTLSGEAYALTKFVPKSGNPVVVDVGANVGDFATEVLDHNAQAKLYCFEPHPANYQRLDKLASTKGFQAFQLGMGSELGSFTLYDKAGDDGSQHASMLAGVITDLHASESVAHQIDIITLDQFAQKSGIGHIDFLKIDTEGFEYQVLLGAKELLAKGAIKVIQFEFNEMNVVSRVWLKDFAQILTGYTLYRLMPDGLLPLEPLRPAVTEIFAFQNIIALKK